jgi:hypothetical protein
MSKEDLRRHNHFFEIDPKELESFEEWAEYLESILNSGRCIVVELNGKLELLVIKALVATVRGMKIEVYPNEHPPPHFHVKSASIDASLTIQDCSLICGVINNDDYKKIKYWYQRGAKQILIKSWNSSRPSDCSVGPYRE